MASTQDYLSGLQYGKPTGGVGVNADKLNPEFSNRLSALVRDAVAATGDKSVYINEGYRAAERQAQLYADYTGKPVSYGGKSYAPATPGKSSGNKASPPGKSRHQSGAAVDVYAGNQLGKVNDGPAWEWMLANLDKYGLQQTDATNDPAHIELTNSDYKKVLAGKAPEAWAIPNRPPGLLPETEVATALDAVNTMAGAVSSGALGYAPLPAPVAPYSRNTAFNPLPAPAPLVAPALRGMMNRGQPANGIVEPGNINLSQRPITHLPDGSVATVRSMSFNEDGQEILVPTVGPTGQLLTDDQAIDLYHQTGQHLGKFSNVSSANNYAEQLHRSQEAMASARENRLGSLNVDMVGRSLPAPPTTNPLTGFGGMTGTAKTPQALSNYKAAYRNSINGVQPISPTDASRYENSGSSRPAAPLQSLAPPPLPSRITPTDPGLPSFTPTPKPISAADANRMGNSGSSGSQSILTTPPHIYTGAMGTITTAPGPVSQANANRIANSGSSQSILTSDPRTYSRTAPVSQADANRMANSGSNSKPASAPAPISAADANRYANSGSVASKSTTPKPISAADANRYANSGSSKPIPAAVAAPKTVPMMTPKAGLVVPTTKTIANPNFAKEMADWESMYGASSTSAGANALGNYMALSKPKVAPPKPSKTLTVTVKQPATAPAWNPLGDALGWAGGKAGEIGAAVGDAASALPGQIDAAKGQLIQKIMMSPEARSPFINGAIGSIGKNGREYAGDGMVSALRLNHDTGEFERYLRKEVVPITKPGMQTYRDAAASTSSLSSNGPGTLSDPAYYKFLLARKSNGQKITDYMQKFLDGYTPPPAQPALGTPSRLALGLAA